MNPIETSIKNKIEQYGTPLSKWDIQINYGIKTGYNNAFIINESTKNALIASDPKSAELIRPILRGKDVKRYSFDFAKLWVIYVPCGYTNRNRGANNPEIWFKENHPSIYSYLINTENELSKNRSKNIKGLYKRDDQGDYWWELRSCKYMDNFNIPKLMYSEIVQSPQFYYDDEIHFYPEATTFIMNGSNLKSLLLILNSDISFSIFKLYYAGGGLGEKGIRYKKAFLLNLRLPNISNEQIEKLENIYQTLKESKFKDSNILDDVNDIVAELYHLNELETKYLLSLDK